MSTPQDPFSPPPGGQGAPPAWGQQPPSGQPLPGQPPAWGQQPGPGWQQPPGGGRPTNTLAIVSLVLIFTVTPAALVTGIIARKQIRQTGEAGDGFALAGIIVGAISIAFFVLLIIGFVLLVAVGASGSLDLEEAEPTLRLLRLALLPGR